MFGYVFVLRLHYVVKETWQELRINFGAGLEIPCLGLKTSISAELALLSGRPVLRKAAIPTITLSCSLQNSAPSASTTADQPPQQQDAGTLISATDLSARSAAAAMASDGTQAFAAADLVAAAEPSGTPVAVAGPPRTATPGTPQSASAAAAAVAPSPAAETPRGGAAAVAAEVGVGTEVAPPGALEVDVRKLAVWASQQRLCIVVALAGAVQQVLREVAACTTRSDAVVRKRQPPRASKEESPWVGVRLACQVGLIAVLVSVDRDGEDLPIFELAVLNTSAQAEDCGAFDGWRGSLQASLPFSQPFGVPMLSNPCFCNLKSPLITLYLGCA